MELGRRTVVRAVEHGAVIALGVLYKPRIHLGIEKVILVIIANKFKPPRKQLL